MKKVLNFLAWNWRKYDIWQKLWWFACFNLGGYVVAQKGSTHEQVCQYLFVVPMFIVFFKWFIWDMVKHSWDEYNKEQERIVEIIRDGK